MRNLRKLLVFAVMAIAAMAFAASTASAQGLQIKNEATGVDCTGAAVTGTDVNDGCLIHANSEGEVELRKHVFFHEEHITTCKNEFHGRVSTSANATTAATGFIFEQVLTTMQPSPPHRVCNRQPCKNVATGEAIPWNASGQEGSTSLEAAANGEKEFLTTNFCVEPIGDGSAADETCEIDVPFDAHHGTVGNHSQEFGHANELSSHGVTGFRCELVGHWNTETGGVHTGPGEPSPGGSPEVEVTVTHLN